MGGRTSIVLISLAGVFLLRGYIAVQVLCFKMVQFEKGGIIVKNKYVKINWNKVMKWIAVIILIICLIKIPFVLQESKNTFVAEHYDAFLSYIGAFLAAMLGMMGIILTILDSQNARREDLIQSVKPFFILDPVMVVNDYSIFSLAADIQKASESPDHLTKGYQEYKFEKLFFVVTPTESRVQLELTKRQKELVHTNGLERKKVKNGGQCFLDNPLLYFRFESANVGKGVAVNCNIGLHKMDLTKPLPPQMESVNCCVPFTIEVGKKLPIAIYSESKIEDIQGVYVLFFDYVDLYGNEYHQYFEIDIHNEGSSFNNVSFTNVEDLKIVHEQTKRVKRKTV